ncbi:MAG: protein-L-isoaspartate(D-aspartate) O-methyltransferase [Bacteroidales bacterium]|jgi:protein-L-isoaspartate(D-aspartate) O-methyltransferase|nr:protein-L-isoaspartate(D-aspartate) O-methyltransferase [Bacteroidales bacterium]
MKDSILHKGKRKQLIEELRSKGVRNEQVLDAMMLVPRHVFFDIALENHAYEDKAFPIDAGQTISQPYTVAVQSSLLNVQKYDRILEIGTGSGYQAAVLCRMGAQVFSIERQKKLFFTTKNILQKLHIHTQLFLGDGFKGLPQFAPFDKILITAAAPFIPRTLLNQLKINGLLVVPYGEGNTQKMIRITKISETEFEQEEHGNFSFVPMLKGIQE